MTKEQILSSFSFLDINNSFHHDQLDVYDDWVINALEYENVLQIIDYISEYDIGAIDEFFLYQLDIFLYSFNERFKPLWEHFIQELGPDYSAQLSDIIIYDEFARIENELF